MLTVYNTFGQRTAPTWPKVTLDVLPKKAEANQGPVHPNPSQAHLCKQKQVLRHRAEARMSNVFAMKKQLVSESNNPVQDMQAAATQA